MEWLKWQRNLTSQYGTNQNVLVNAVVSQKCQYLRIVITKIMETCVDTYLNSNYSQDYFSSSN